MELLRFYSAKDLRELAKGCGQAVHLPPDFQLSYELLRGMSHEHWPMRQVQGGWVGAREGRSGKSPISSRWSEFHQGLCAHRVQGDPGCACLRDLYHSCYCR